MHAPPSGSAQWCHNSMRMWGHPFVVCMQLAGMWPPCGSIPARPLTFVDRASEQNWFAFNTSLAMAWKSGSVSGEW